MTNKFYQIEITVLVAISLVARFFLLNWHGLNYDELITFDVIHYNSLKEVLIWIRDHDTQLPAYYALIYFVKWIFGSSVFILRLTSLIFDLLAHWQLFLLLREFGDKRRTWVGVVLFSYMFLVLRYSVEVRPYALLTFLSTITIRYIYLFSKGKKVTVTNLLTYIFSAIFLGLTHYYGLLLLILQIFYVAYLSFQKDRRLFKIIMIISAVTGFILYPLMSDILTDLIVKHQFRPELKFYDFLGYVSYFFSGTFTLLLLIISLLGLKIMANPRKAFINQSLLLFIGLPVIVLLVALLKNILISPSLEPRYMVVVLPSVMVLISHLTDWNSKRGQFLFYLLLACMIGNVTFKEQFFKRVYQLDSEGAANRILELKRVHPKSSILNCNICLRAYLQKTNLKCWNDDRKEQVSDIWEDSFFQAQLILAQRMDSCQLSDTLKDKYELKNSQIFKGISVQLWEQRSISSGI